MLALITYRFCVSGKIEIVFEKVVPELWSNFGIFERTRSKDETVYSEFKIVAKHFFNHDSFELILRPNKTRLLIVPVGYHLNFRLSLYGEVENICNFVSSCSRISR